MFYGKTKINHAILSNGNIKNGPIEVITIYIDYLSLFKPKVAKSLMLEFDPICRAQFVSMLMMLLISFSSNITNNSEI